MQILKRYSRSVVRRMSLVFAVNCSTSLRLSCFVFGPGILLAIGLIASAVAGSTNNPDAKLPPTVKPLTIPGVHNLFSLGTNIYSGSAPDDDAAFAAVAKLGVKTIITVDGAAPNLELAHKYGMRYVHLPHGYDGIDAETEAKLLKAAKTLPGPILVHCHHGMHRGPAAAAVICMGEQGWTPEQGEAWLHKAGTGSNYTGLFETVRRFRPPSPSELKLISPELPEVVKVSGLVDAMVAIDERWDSLKAIRKAGYKAPPEHPDVQPAHEALILREHYREAQRLPESAAHGEKFLEILKKEESQVAELEKYLRQFEAHGAAEVRENLDASFEKIGRTCSSCHKEYRDPAGIKSGGQSKQ